MRDIKFRGKRLDNGQWVYGYLIKLKVYKPKNQDERCGEVIEVPACFIQPFSHEDYETEYRYEVDPETVGEYTGLEDKNGVGIYERDVLSLNGDIDLWSTLCGVVEFRRGAFISAYNWKDKEKYDYLEGVYKDREVIGNIDDNPELMEVGE